MVLRRCQEETFQVSRWHLDLFCRKKKAAHSALTKRITKQRWFWSGVGQAWMNLQYKGASLQKSWSLARQEQPRMLSHFPRLMLKTGNLSSSSFSVLKKGLSHPFKLCVFRAVRSWLTYFCKCLTLTCPVLLYSSFFPLSNFDLAVLACACLPPLPPPFHQVSTGWRSPTWTKYSGCPPPLSSAAAKALCLWGRLYAALR